MITPRHWEDGSGIQVWVVKQKLLLKKGSNKNILIFFHFPWWWYFQQQKHWNAGWNFCRQSYCETGLFDLDWMIYKYITKYIQIQFPWIYNYWPPRKTFMIEMASEPEINHSETHTKQKNDWINAIYLWFSVTLNQQTN